MQLKRIADLMASKQARELRFLMGVCRTRWRGEGAISFIAGAVVSLLQKNAG